MKKIYLGVLISLLSTAIHSQSVNLEWARSMGGIYSDVAYSITTDASGNLYITGGYYGTVDFDPGVATFNLTSNGSQDIFVQKLDASGNFIWAKSMGGSSIDYALSITIDAWGNVYTTGGFHNTADFDPSPAIFDLISNGDYDVFIQKLDSNGNFIWANSMGATSLDLGQSVSTDASGNVYVTGNYYTTVDFDPSGATYNLTSNGSADIFIQKLDPNGNLIWVNSFGGAYYDFCRSSTTDNSGNVYVTGAYQDSVDFDPSGASFNLTSNGNGDIFIQKLGPNGNLIWAKSMGATDYDGARSIKTDATGNIYVTGYYAGTVDFDPSGATFNLTANGNADIFIQKLDANGNFIWANSIGGISSNNSESITIDNSGNVYVTGDYEGTVDFDPSGATFFLTANGSDDVFIEKLDANGNFIWAKSVGDASSDRGNSIITDVLGNVYVSGLYGDTVDFDPDSAIYNLTSNGGNDVFVLKLSQCAANTGSETVTTCDTYTWVADGNTYTSTGTYTAILTNTLGCDSTITLDLTINTIDTSVIVDSLMLTSATSGASYQWIDCNASNTAISGATNESYIATANGSYAVIITANGCTDTSSCYTILTTGLTENTFGTALTVSPNPTANELTVDLGATRSRVTIKVRNLMGQLISSSYHETAAKVILAIEGEPGVYFVNVQTYDGNMATFKIMKK
ncbi:MAG: T9SS type A sorting domain-containing protein [Flavobacteriales bacterium]|nr:T9SS type A sorting domain-containing protein [Flavobacteriales bacterium]